MAKKKRVDNGNNRDSSLPGGNSNELIEYKEQHGLPMWKDLTEEIEETSKRHGASWAEEILAKVDVYRKFTDFQVTLATNFKAMGGDRLNSMHNFIDLQMKLFELEDKLKSEGKNPLESPEWVKARELLMKEQQFIYKHGLDKARFAVEVEKAKKKIGDDELFVVEAE